MCTQYSPNSEHLACLVKPNMPYSRSIFGRLSSYADFSGFFGHIEITPLQDTFLKLRVCDLARGRRGEGRTLILYSFSGLLDCRLRLRVWWRFWNLVKIWGEDIHTKIKMMINPSKIPIYLNLTPFLHVLHGVPPYNPCHIQRAWH